MGLPTISLRPRTTACWPATGQAAAGEHLHDAGGGAGLQAGLAALQAAYVDGVEAVDVFVGRDGFEEEFGVDVCGQGELDEDAVDFVAGIEFGDEGKELLGGDAFGRREHLGVESEFATGFDLAAHVDFAGGD